MIYPDGNGGSNIPDFNPKQIKFFLSLIIGFFSLSGIVFGIGCGYTMIKTDIQANSVAIEQCAVEREVDLKFEVITTEIGLYSQRLDRLEQKIDRILIKVDK